MCIINDQFKLTQFAVLQNDHKKASDCKTGGCAPPVPPSKSASVTDSLFVL